MGWVMRTTRILRGGTAVLILTGLPILLGVAGCSGEKMDEVVAAAKAKSQDLATKTKEATAGAADQLKEATKTIGQQTGQIVESSQEKLGETRRAIEDALPGSGRVTLQTEPPMQTAIARWTVIDVPTVNGTATIWQLTTYRTDGEIDAYPAVMLRAVLTDGDATQTGRQRIDAKVGQSIACQLFAQRSADAPIVSTRDGQTVHVQLNAIDEAGGQLTATIDPAELIQTDGQTVSLAGGVIDGHWIQSNPQPSRLAGFQR